MKDNTLPRALIINTPYIEQILLGQKTWDMRSRRSNIRGKIGLIQKGSGNVVGVIDLVGSLGPLSKEDILHNLNNHRLCPEQLDCPLFAKWRFAWLLENAYRLPYPVKYPHPKGAVVWVMLDTKTQNAILKQI